MLTRREPSADPCAGILTCMVTPLLLAFLVASQSAPSAPSAAEPAPLVRSLERPGDGRPSCGLGGAFHAGRRAELRERVGSGLLLFRGLPETRDYTAFRQDKTFWYLTGIESPNAALVLDADTGREVLFLPERDLRRERWDGEMWDSSDEWVGELTGFAEVRPTGTLLPSLRELLGERRSIAVCKHPWVGLGGGYDRAEPADRARAADPLDGRISREQALEESLAKRLEVEVRDVSDVLIDMRRVKRPEEIEAMRRAGRAGALAMHEAMRSTTPGTGEWELDALMSFVQVREGAAGPAYHAIVGSGPNSCTLHYSASSRRLGAGEVVLIDYGPEVDHYTTDITRTWPVDGEFTPRMAELYDAVLAAQAAGIAAVAPGKTLTDVEGACAAVLRERGLADLIRHGSCHYIGLEVHDPGDYARALEPGVTFTVEPGLYDAKEGIGVRIEDVVVVTPDGCEVLTGDVPKARAEVERAVRERGLLDPAPPAAAR